MATQQDEREKLLYHFFYVLFKRKWMIPSLFILTMVLILFFTYLMTPMWEATTLVLVEPNPKKQMILFPDITSPAAPTSQDRQPLNFIQLLTGRNMAYEVVKKYDLDHLLEEQENNPQTSRDVLKRKLKDFFKLPITALINLGLLNDRPEDYVDMAADELIDHWEDIDVVEETQVISLTVSAPSPKMAENIANFMADSLAKKTVLLSNDEVTRTYDSTSKKLSEIEDSLRNAHEQLRGFREKEKVILLSEEEKAKTNQYIELETKYNFAFNEKNTLQATLGELDRQLKKRNSKTVISTTVATNPAIATLKTSLTELETKMASLLKEKKESHPEVSKIKSEIEIIREQLKNEVEKIVQNEVITADPIYQSLLEQFTITETKLYSIESELEGLSKVIVALNTELLKYPGKEIEYARFTGRVEMYKVLAESLKRKLEELRIVKDANFNEASLKILDRAYVSQLRNPEWPKWLLTIFVGIIMASGISIGYPFFLEYWNGTITRRREIEDLIGVPVIGSLPQSRKFRSWNRSPGGNGAYNYDNDPGTFDILKRIGTNLMLIAGRDNRRVFLITSYSNSEGKTTVAANLSHFFSFVNKDTLFITNPNERTKKPENKDVPNLENAITKGYPMELLKETNGDACYLMYYDVFSLNLSNTETIDNFFSQAKNHFDMVFIDSPSLTDNHLPLFLSPMVDGVILVVDQNTRREQILQAKGKIEMANGRLVGVIYNKYEKPIPDFLSQKLRIEN